MTAEMALGIVERVGVPVAMLLAGVAVVWRLSGLLLRALLASHEARLDEVRADREYFRARCGTDDELMAHLARAVLEQCERPKDGEP